MKSIDEYAEEGNSLFDDERYDEAIKVWQEALGMLGEPLNMQSEAVWFCTSIGDALFIRGQYGEAYRYLYDAKSNLSGEGADNPFVLMRLGQCSYELGRDDAKEYLLRAYMLAGEEAFEYEDPKYIGLIKDML